RASQRHSTVFRVSILRVARSWLFPQTCGSTFFLPSRPGMLSRHGGLDSSSVHQTLSRTQRRGCSRQTGLHVVKEISAALRPPEIGRGISVPAAELLDQ